MQNITEYGLCTSFGPRLASRQTQHETHTYNLRFNGYWTKLFIKCYTVECFSITIPTDSNPVKNPSNNYVYFLTVYTYEWWQSLTCILNQYHDDVIKWKHFPRYFFVRGIHSQRPVAWSFDASLICAWTDGYGNNQDAGELRRHRTHYDVTVMHDGCLALITYPQKMSNVFIRTTP